MSDFSVAPVAQNYLRGQQNGLAMGNAARVQQQSFVEGKRQNALRDYQAQNAVALMAGDPAAIQGLAAIAGPTAALKLQEQVSSTRAAGQKITLGEADLQKVRLEAESIAANMSRDELAAQRAETDREIRIMAGLKTEGEWDQFAQSFGQGELVGQFHNRDAWVQANVESLDVLKRLDKQNAPAEIPAPLSPEGKINADVQRGWIDPNAQVVDFDSEQKLRKEFVALPAVKAFSSVKDAYGRIAASAENPSAAGDLALIFNFMKVLDPGSVVRESEFATAEQATAWLQKSEEAGTMVPQPVASAIRKFNTGQRLSPGQRDDFVSRAEGLFNSQERNYNQQVQRYQGLAERYGLSPEAIAMTAEKYGVEPEQAAEAINKGEVEVPKPEAPEDTSGYSFQNEQQQTIFEKYSQ